MAVFRKPETRFWWYSVYIGGGKRLVGSTGKTDRAEAVAIEQVIRMAHAGETPRDRLVAVIDALHGREASGLPLAGVWGAYAGFLASTGKELADISLRQRRRACERFSAWAAEAWPAVRFAGGVDRACAAGFAAWLAGKGSAGKTRRNLIANLGTVWEGLRRVRDDVTVNPWPLVLPDGRGERLDAFTREEEAAVLAVADGAGWGLACRIARHTGLRYGDVATLTWDRVDLALGVIRARPSKTARHGVTVAVPICAELRAALSAADEARKNERGRWAEYVCPQHARYYPNPRLGPQGLFSGVLRAAGVSGRHTFHSWRHTFRTRLAEAGVSDEIAKRLGGWTNDETAMRYDHDGRAKELTEAVERASS